MIIDIEKQFDAGFLDLDEIEELEPKLMPESTAGFLECPVHLR